MDNNNLSFAIVIPTLNPGTIFDEWISSLASQSLQPDRLIVVDTSSSDNTVAKAIEYGAETIIVKPEDFDHGGTRQFVIDKLSDIDIAVLVTQDAFFAKPDSLFKIIEIFKDDKIGVAYGRQLPHKNAKPIEAHARLFNYPKKSHICSINDIPTYGFKTAFVSNSYSAWRRSALMKVGGFPKGTILSEDHLVASKMILNGWKVAYCAEAEVFHSHDFSIRQEFQRYFDIGVFHARESWIREKFGEAGGEGFRFVKSELKHLSNYAPHMIPSAMIRTVCKLIGYKLGNAESYLPLKLKKRLSMNKPFWRT